MKADIHLFINDKEIEFSKDPQILFNYKLSDITNPVAVKNSFSKSIVIEGTPANNDIFSHIWNLESYYNGGNFNHFKKADFVIYINGNIYEKGYVKLDNVTMKNHNIEYSITLYGGLGQYIWNLTYANGEGNTKLTLADLSYQTDNYAEPNLDFNITKDAVWDAWHTLMGDIDAVYDEKNANRPSNYLYDEKWKMFNFAPICNGIPQNFDAAKVLINHRGINGIFNWTKDGYAAVNGYLLGETSEDLTEWETRDLRSYNQRGVVKMSRIIEACCQPVNNGGYQVKLDEHFFNEDNPYWNDAWITTKMCSEMKLEQGKSTVIDRATIVKNSSNIWNVVYDKPELAKYTNLNMKVRVKVNPKSTPSKNLLYTHSHYQTNPTVTLVGSKFIKDYDGSGNIMIQLLAKDASDRTIGYSKAYILGDSRYEAFSQGDIADTGYISSEDGEYTFVQGMFRKNGSSYEFCNMSGAFVGIDFSLKSQADFDHLVMKVYTTSSHRTKYVFSGKGALGNEAFRLYGIRDYSDRGNKEWGEVMNILEEVLCDVSFDIDSFSVTANDYEGLISGSKVTKDKLLASDKTPADYLLSYCKMFGLHIFQDPTEVADDELLCPKGVIHIMDRDSFYKRNEIVDISHLVDYNKGLQIKPQVADTKYYSFYTEQVDSDIAENYKNTYKTNYGEQTVNTNYDFDSQTKKLYDGSVFKGGIMVREKDKYFNMSPDIPIYAYNGMKYSLFKAGEGYEYDTLELDLSGKVIASDPINKFGLAYYDNLPKMQLHSADNQSIDGSDILLFYVRGQKTNTETGWVDYWITDDIGEMGLLNDGSPCWIMTLDERNTAGATIAYKINMLPWFSRNLYAEGQTGPIAHTWDFGASQATYVPDTFNIEGMSIYEKCWKNYVNDIYSIDSRKLTCYLNLTEKPDMNWLRRFYWFENAIWRINSIIDYNLSIDGVTKFEFIKVQDIEDYSLEKIVREGSMRIVLNQKEISYAGGPITGYVYVEDGDPWAFADVFTYYDNTGTPHYVDAASMVTPFSGRGIYTNFTLNVPENELPISLDWDISLAKYVWETIGKRVYATFTQGPDRRSYIRFSPTEKTVDFTSQNITLDFSIKNILTDTLTLRVGDNLYGQTLDIPNRKAKFNIYRNTGDARTTTVTLSGTDINGDTITATATIHQKSDALTVSPSAIVLDYDANSTGTIGVTTESSYTITIEDK